MAFFIIQFIMITLHPITIKFEHTEEFDGLNGRIIQHEYDHIEGKLFTDRISPLKRRLLKNRLEDITKGKVDVRYKMKFPIR